MSRITGRPKLIHQISVDEGHFDTNGEFIVDRQRSGDAICGGAWVAPDVGVVRGYFVRLNVISPDLLLFSFKFVRGNNSFITVS